METHVDPRNIGLVGVGPSIVSPESDVACHGFFSNTISIIG